MTRRFPEERVALFPGSFNPFTRGHQSIVDRALGLFDRVVIALGYNMAKEGAAAAADERLEPVRRLYAGDSRVEVTAYAGLTATFASQTGASAIVRGVRNVADFEYERTIAEVNRRLTGIETVLLFTLPELECVSSSIVRELVHHGADVGAFMPDDPVSSVTQS